jgi:hypothetical protein
MRGVKDGRYRRLPDHIGGVYRAFAQRSGQQLPAAIPGPRTGELAAPLASSLPRQAGHGSATQGKHLDRPGTRRALAGALLWLTMLMLVG